jgi:diguanylate cyclase (GGDEF)-like protein
MSATRSKVCLVVCENLAREAMAALSAEKLDDVALATFPACCDTPLTNWDTLAAGLVGDPGCYRLFWMGRCGAGLGDPPPQLGQGRRIPIDSCLEHLSQALTRARHDGTTLAVLFIDLDRFKQINDTLGHETADLLIKEVASRLQKAVRTDDLVARMGGDEFLLLLPEAGRPEDAVQVARRIRASLAPPFHLAGYELRVTASVGIALYPEAGEDAETLMRNADVAMYRVKEGGRDGWQVYGKI